MTASDLAESFRHGGNTSQRTLDVYGFAVASGAATSSVVLLISAAFAVADDASDFAVLAVAAVLTGALAYALGRRPVTTRSLRPVPALSAAVIAYVFVAGVSTVVYLLTGAFDRVDDAVYESVTGVSTSALTLLDDPAALGDGVLIWRAGTQWIGGLAALALAVGLLPFLGGSRELGDLRGRRRSGSALAPKPTRALRRVAVIYLLATGFVIVALATAGMGFRDTIAHAFSTVSTGGFSTHAAGIGHYDSLAIELAVVVAMAGAGSSVALVWMVWRGQFSDTRRALELQLYCAVLVGGTAWVWWLNHDIDAGAGRGLREALFTVVSMVTTTGHSVADWGTWHPGATALLLMMTAVGGMSGSVAGGLRWMRVIGLAQFLWRELQRQLHPRSVRAVKVGSSPLTEASVDRMHSQLVYMMLAGTAGALALAYFGAGIVEALSLSVSAVSTTGPGFSDSGTIATAAELSATDRAVLLPLMMAGRVFLYPALVLVGAGFFGASRKLRSGRDAAEQRMRMRRAGR